MEKTLNWNLTDIYSSPKQAYEDFEKIKKLKKELAEYKGKLNTRENILAFFKLSTKEGVIETRFVTYIHLKKSINNKDEEALKMEADYENFETQISPQLAFIEPEISKNPDEMLLKLSLEADFKDYKIFLEDVVKNKKHIPKEEISKVLSLNPAFDMGSDIFDALNDVDFKFGFVNVNGKEVELTHASYGALIVNSDQDIRKEANDKLYKVYEQFNHTLGTIFLNSAKETLFFNKIHKFKSVLEESCNQDKTDPEVLTTLIKAVRKHLYLYYAYQEKRKQLLKLDTYYYFDSNIPLGKSVSYEYNDACEIVLKALGVMGDKYITLLKKAMTENWIDVYEKPSKTSGGFCCSSYGLHPYVLLNYAKTYSDMSTIAHELGHAMHGYFTNTTQPFEYSDPSIFACEVASIVNEILLLNYMIKNAKTKDEKTFFIGQFLTDFYATVYRQTMFSEFEYNVYTSLENSRPLIVSDLNNMYEKLQADYFGSGAQKTPLSKYEWSRIPHFYRPYYVYKYATGFISACTIAENILENKKGYLDKYFNFLKAGSSVDPITLLKSVDVDLTRAETFNGAFKLFENYLNAL